MGAQNIRDLVARCYVGMGSLLAPNSLDQLNPYTPTVNAAVQPVASDPAAIIRELVGRCYEATPPLMPNPLDQFNPPPAVVPVVPDPVPTPSEVIQTLVGRCYPDLPTLEKIPDEVDAGGDWTICDVTDQIDWARKFVDLDIGKIIVKTPDPNDPSGFVRWDGSQCEEVLKYRRLNQIKSVGGGWWEHITTGERYYCDDTNWTPDIKWENCVRTALECMFRPYIGGKWTPPKSDCESHYNKGWSANRDEICIANCYPDRIAIYESSTANDNAYHTTATPPAGYTLTSSTPAFYILKNEEGDKTAPLFKYYSGTNNDTFLTINPGQPDSPGNGERATMNASGMVFVDTLGHVFPSATNATSYLADGETAKPLHRFFQTSPFNHKYMIDADVEGMRPERTDRWCYSIPQKCSADLNILLDCEHGAAGYDNALGFYLANDSGPQYGVIVCSSAKGGQVMEEVNISNNLLQQYGNGSMGFFLIPNGASVNSLSLGQTVTFSAQSDGFRAVGLSSSQGNYCMFSDRFWNPADKDYTVWHGTSHQMWEDLLNGDDDYDDLKFWHNVRWAYNGWIYEGVAGYVYAKAAPEKVMRKLQVGNVCDGRILSSSFKDVTMRRLDCGTNNPTIQSNSEDHECGQCSGGYSVKLNTLQTVEVKKSATFKVVSLGGIIGGLEADCLKFTLRFAKNGQDLINKQFKVKYWPKIGQDLVDGVSVSVVPGDTVTLEVVSIDVGPHTGYISPSMGIYAEEEGVFTDMVNLQLGTGAHDDIIGSTMGGTVTNPLGTTLGAVQGFAMQFRPSLKESDEWQPGAKAAETWLEDDVPQDEYPWTNVWASGAAVAMHGSLQANPDLPGNTRIFNNGLMPNIPGAYIDTGYVYDGNEYYLDSILPTLNYRRQTGTYNHFLEEHLVTRYETLSGTPVSQTVRQAAPTAFAMVTRPWYDLGLQSFGTSFNTAVDNLWDGSKQAPNIRDTYYSPCTFIHDYILDSTAGSGAANIADACKVRVGITFYPVVTNVTQAAGSRTVHYWQAMIHVLSVVNAGAGYTEGQKFVLHWPPIRDPKTEDASASPYYPDQESGFAMPNTPVVSWYEDSSMVKRMVKEAVYMESHNKDSVIWYTSTDKNEFRVRFSIIITETT